MPGATFVAVRAGTGDPVSAFARSLRPLVEPASKTNEVGGSPPAGVVHVRTTVGPDTAAMSDVGATGTKIGETVRTVDRGVRRIIGAVASDPQTPSGTTGRKIEPSAIDIVQQAHERDTPPVDCALTLRLTAGNERPIPATSANSSTLIH